MTQPKVSVIVPNYNHASYLPQRLDSILTQTYQDFELIILDDCSSDHSRKIIEKYSQSDDRIKFFFNDRNSGSPFAQWHRGLKFSCGEYIWIAESDDYASHDFLETLITTLDNHPSVGIAYCQSWAVDENNSILYSYTRWTEEFNQLRWESNHTNKGKNELEEYFCIKNTIPNASAVVFRKEYVVSSSFIEETMRLCGDKIFWARILLKSDVAFISSHLNFFRHHSNNSRSKTKELEAIIDNYKWLWWLKSNIEISQQRLEKVEARIYTWTAGYLVDHPIQIGKIYAAYFTYPFDHFFVFKITYKSLKEIFYRLFSTKLYPMADNNK